MDQGAENVVIGPQEAAFRSHDADLADLLGDMISAHAPDGTYRYVSASSHELLGYDPADLLGTWAYDLFHPDDIVKVSVAHRNVLENTPFTVSYRMRRANGTYVWVETTSRTIRDPATDETIEILCCTRPIENHEVIARLSDEEQRQKFDRVQRVLAGTELTSVYQPIIDLESGRAIALEALSRFAGPEGFAPDRWFRDGWEVGLGAPLEMMAVRSAAAALPKIEPGMGLTLNVSPPTLAGPGFLQALGDDAGRVTVELTEHLRISDYEGVRSALAPVRAAGTTVAIDDFGAGYASLQHVLKVAPEWIKLDISLTERIDENEVAHALAESLISFAERVGVKVIAEGIETVEQLDALTDLGFRYGQGFYFAVPAPLDEALASLS